MAIVGIESASLSQASQSALTQDSGRAAEQAQDRTMDSPTSSTQAPESEGAARRAARLATPRLTRECATIAAMLQIYCGDHHAAAVLDDRRLCADCAGLLDYARKRLAACPFGADKPTCVNCQIHCYGARQREAVRVAMRHAGPRMLWRHPLLALAHLVDGRRPAPPKPRGKVAAPVQDSQAPPPH